MRASLAASSTSGNPKDRSVKFLDSSWHLDKTRDAKKEFLGTFMRIRSSVVALNKCATACYFLFRNFLPPSLLHPSLLHPSLSPVFSFAMDSFDLFWLVDTPPPPFAARSSLPHIPSPF